MFSHEHLSTYIDISLFGTGLQRVCLCIYTEYRRNSESLCFVEDKIPTEFPNGQMESYEFSDHVLFSNFLPTSPSLNPKPHTTRVADGAKGINTGFVLPL